jgi:hypothetical protein
MHLLLVQLDFAQRNMDEKHGIHNEVSGVLEVGREVGHNAQDGFGSTSLDVQQMRRMVSTSHGHDRRCTTLTHGNHL